MLYSCYIIRGGPIDSLHDRPFVYKIVHLFHQLGLQFEDLLFS